MYTATLTLPSPGYTTTAPIAKSHWEIRGPPIPIHQAPWEIWIDLSCVERYLPMIVLTNIVKRTQASRPGMLMPSMSSNAPEAVREPYRCSFHRAHRSFNDECLEGSSLGIGGGVPHGQVLAGLDGTCCSRNFRCDTTEQKERKKRKKKTKKKERKKLRYVLLSST